MVIALPDFLKPLTDPLVAAMWAECRVVCGSPDFRLISPVDLRRALVAALRRHAAIMRRDHADLILVAEYERLAGEVER
jgi:hypothetical protein